MAKLLPNESVLFLPELLQRVSSARERFTRQQMLVEYASKDETHERVLQSLIELTWHPAVIWELPEGRPPYAESSAPVGAAPNNLFRVFREASRFLKGGGGFIDNAQKRETYFVQLLEGLANKEAQLLCAVKDKDIQSLYPNFTLDLVCQVFPDWLPKDLIAANPPIADTDAKKAV